MQLSKTLLKSLNLSPAQAAVYFAALELGGANIQVIARKSGIKRTSIYNFIDELKARGLILETIKRKRKMYSGVDPEQLVELEKTRVAELERSLPELRAIKNISRTKPRVSFYEGIVGIKEVYGDMLNDKKEIIAFEDLEHMRAGLPKQFYDWFPPERARRGIPFRSISRDSETAKEFAKNNIRLLRETKLVKSADWKTEINIYGNKVALMSFRTRTPFCVLIEDQDIAETLRDVWGKLWDNLDLTKIG